MAHSLHLHGAIYRITVRSYRAIPARRLPSLYISRNSGGAAYLRALSM